MKITFYPRYFIRRLSASADRNSFFSAGYRLLYPEYHRHGMTPWQHYVIDGFRKGYGNGLNPPDSVFFPDGYLLEYPDVAESGEDPWRHYAGRGHDEGRDNGLHPGEDLFFAGGYLAMYPDVAESGMDPWRHYVMTGRAEGRDNGLHPADDVFFAAGYLAMYPDVAESGMDPWRHYVTLGKSERRDSGNHPGDALFYADGYLAMYPDVAESGMDPWRHYATLGKAEGRGNGLHPSDDVFFPEGYVAEYQDVARSGQDPWRHYVAQGKAEGRDNGLHPGENDFFAAGYLEEYQDVAKSGADPWLHFALSGKAEGRGNGLHPSDNVFFPEGYLVMYPDVEKSGIDPWHHYVLFGKAEGRDNGLHPGKEVFFEAGYRAMYPDVGKSRVDPWHHYVLFGRNEGRDSGHHPGDAEFFAAGYLAGLYGNSGNGPAKTKVREYPYQKRPLDIDLTDVDLSEKMEFPSFSDPLVSIVIPCYNHFDVTMRCLRALLKNTKDVSYEVIIADDHSKDETRNIGKYASNVRYIANKKDNGFVNNCNSGASIAKGKYLYFLNNDTEVQPCYLKPLTDLIESDPGIGIVGSMLIFADGTLQESGGQIFEDSRGSNVGRGLRNIDDVTVNYVRDTDYISGAALMIRNDLFRELGGFDEVYSPAYCEDSDLCLRVWYRKHKRVVIQPKSRVVHLEGQSFPSAKKEALIQRNNQTLFRRFFAELSAHHCCAEHNSFVFKDHASHKQQMLVIDWKILSTSFDTGSRVTFQYMRLFREMGMNVKYYPMDVFLEKHEFLEDLEQIGVEVIFEDFASYIARNGKFFDYVFVNRPNVTQRYLRQLRFFTRAQIIYQGHDLHYLRRYRENLAIKKPDAEEIMLKERKEEFDVIRYCDLPCFVSQDEVDLVNKAMPFSHCIKLPIFLFDVRNMTKVYKAAERKDICFVAGFQHSPNIDGACWFVNKVWPAVKKKIPDLKIYIIGSKPSAEVRALASDSVIVTGYVTDEELEDYYSKVRMAVIPLNFGAGVKGKTVEAVYNKVPVLTTKIGAEGIDNSMGVLTVENDAESFSAKLIEMYNNEKELQRISDMSAEFIRSQFTKEKAIEIFDRYLVK